MKLDFSKFEDAVIGSDEMIVPIAGGQKCTDNDIKDLIDLMDGNTFLLDIFLDVFPYKCQITRDNKYFHLSNAFVERCKMLGFSISFRRGFTEEGNHTITFEATELDSEDVEDFKDKRSEWRSTLNRYYVSRDVGFDIHRAYCDKCKKLKKVGIIDDDGEEKLLLFCDCVKDDDYLVLDLDKEFLDTIGNISEVEEDDKEE